MVPRQSLPSKKLFLSHFSCVTRYDSQDICENLVCNTTIVTENLVFAQKMRKKQNQEHSFLLKLPKYKHMFFKIQSYALFGILKIFHAEQSEFLSPFFLRLFQFLNDTYWLTKGLQQFRQLQRYFINYNVLLRLVSWDRREVKLS